MEDSTVAYTVDVLPPGKNHCQACAFNVYDRYVAKDGRTKLIFNLDGDLTGQTTRWETHNVIYTARGRDAGFCDARDLRYSNEAIALSNNLGGGYFLLEMSPELLKHSRRKLLLAMEHLRKEYPEHTISRKFWEGVTRRKHDELTAITDDVPLILPPDVYETGYDFVSLIAQRGCLARCEGCKVSINTPYRAGIEGIERQIRFFKEDYPLAHSAYKGLVIGGEDPLQLDVGVLVQTLEMAKGAFSMTIRPKLNIVWKYRERREGFAYMFGSFRSLDRKSVDDMQRLREAGLRWLNVGLETAVDDILSGMFNKHTIDQAKTGIEKCQEAGVNMSLNVLCGIGDRDEEHLRKTAEVLKEEGFEGRVYLTRFKKPNGRFATDLSTFLRHGKLFVDEIGIEKNEETVMLYPMIFF